MIPCCYEITVALRGRFLFRCSEERKDTAYNLVRLFQTKFQEQEGYHVSMDYVECYGTPVIS